MTIYFIRRLLLVIPTFLGVTMIAFLITRMVPGGPLERAVMQMQGMGGGDARTSLSTEGGQIPKEALEEIKKAFHLDKPAWLAYALWLGDLAQFDMGQSYVSKEPVSKLITDRFPISIYFGLLGFTLAYLVCIPLGIAKALRHGSHFDFVTSAMVFIGYSIPGWALGSLLLMLFATNSYGMKLFPLGDFRSTTYDQLSDFIREREDYDQVHDERNRFQWDNLSFMSKAVDQVHHTVLPVICYMMGSFATLTVLMKNSILENIGQDYVRTAFAKGLSERRVIYLHLLRNSLIPIATGLGHALSIIMAGSFLIEAVFNIRGLGMLGFESIVSKDYPVVMGILSINILLTLFGNIFSDILYALIDPRIRFE